MGPVCTAGWGGDAGKDQYGRPIVLVMGWSAPTTPAERLNYMQAGQSRSIILHELVHGLGFSIYNFRERKDASGNTNSMVEERNVAGDPLAVWYVTSQRTLTVARSFFGCPNLDGLPLMGENQLGTGSRGSHWETRIMNEEFMAYGEGAKVSGLTIAMLEDLGFYLGNYSSAQCMYWGKNQGCAFVTSRCATRSTTDTSITLSSGEQCNKPYMYAGGVQNGLKTATGSCRYLYANPILTQYCAAPDCTRQWPGMTLQSGQPDWSCSTNNPLHTCTSPPCTCAAECQRATQEHPSQAGALIGTDTGNGEGCTPSLGPVSTPGLLGGLFGDNPLSDYPLVFLVVGLLAVLFFVSSVCRCIKQESFRCLVMTSICINLVFTIAGISFTAATGESLHKQIPLSNSVYNCCMWLSI